MISQTGKRKFSNAGHLLHLALVSFALTQSPSSRSDEPPFELTIEAPCTQKGSNANRIDQLPCSSVIRPSSVPGPVGTPSSRPGILSALEDRVSLEVHCAYYGYIVKYDAPCKPTIKEFCEQGVPRLHASGAKIVPCSQAWNPSEVAAGSNHVGDTCWTAIPDSKYAETTPPTPLKIEGLFAAANTDALRFAAKSVLDEIEQKRQLRLTKRCKAYGERYKKIAEKGKARSDALVASTANMGPTLFSGGLNLCDSDEEIAKVLKREGKGLDAIQDLFMRVPKQSFCKINAGRLNMEALFSDLAICETWSRWEYYSALITDRRLIPFIDQLKAAAKTATQYGEDQADGSRSRGERKGNEKFRELFKNLSNDTIGKIYSEDLPGPFYQPQFPPAAPKCESSPQGSMNPSPDHVSWAFALGALRLRRRKKQKAAPQTQPRNLTLLFSGFVLLNFVLGLGLSALVLLGCTSEPEIPETPEYMLCSVPGLLKKAKYDAEVNAPKTTSCCEPSNPGVCRMDLNSDTEKCDQCGRDAGAVSCYLSCWAANQAQQAMDDHAGGAGTGYSGDNTDEESPEGGELDARSTKDVAVPDAQFGFSGSKESRSSASAGALGSRNKNTGAADASKTTQDGFSKLAEGTGIMNAKTGKGSGGESTGAGGTGGLPSLPGTGINAGSGTAAGSSSGSGAAGSADTGVVGTIGGGASGAGATGAGSGAGGGLFGFGGPGSGSGSSGFGSGFGSGRAGEGGAAGSATRFGPAGATENVGDVPPSASEDPEDYFTRTNLDENLFKKVEKKLHEKQSNWVLQDNSVKNSKSGLKPDAKLIESEAAKNKTKKKGASPPRYERTSPLEER